MRTDRTTVGAMVTCEGKSWQQNKSKEKMEAVEMDYFVLPAERRDSRLYGMKLTDNGHGHWKAVIERNERDRLFNGTEKLII